MLVRCPILSLCLNIWVYDWVRVHFMGTPQSKSVSQRYDLQTGVQLTDELAESQFPGCGGADGLRRELLKVEAADREARQTKRVQVLRRTWRR